MLEIPASLADALSNSYEVVRVVGQGGMSTVYLGTDTKHGRRVAIKVMRDDLSSALVTERFLREIRISASLTHPNILTLIDSGEAAGNLYYVTPYIDGESLREKLKRGPLDIETACRLAGEIGDALSYAHRNDVIHRDIKPENILLSEGHAMVSDFGIAKAISNASDEHLTRTGFPLGTIGYMSPEQAAGGTDMSNATDIYSLACVCYEMVVGVPPGRWITESEIDEGRFAATMPEQRARLDAMASHAEKALLRAMAVNPERRFNTASEFCEALTNPNAEIRYRTDDVDRIIGAAAELDTDVGSGSSMSLRTVEDIGAEVGIPRRAVRHAAGIMGTGTVERTTGFLGWPTGIEADRQVSGEIYGGDYVFALEAIRDTVDEPGQASTLGNSFEWQTANPGVWGQRDVRVTITPKTGKTFINVRERIRTDEVLTAVAGFEVAIGIGAVTTGLIAGGLTWGVASLVGVGGLLAAYARKWADRRTSKREAELKQLADELAGRIGSSRTRI